MTGRMAQPQHCGGARQRVRSAAIWMRVRQPAFSSQCMEGYVMWAKNAQDVNVWKVGIRNIVEWLGSLRAPNECTG